MATLLQDAIDGEKTLVPGRVNHAVSCEGQIDFSQICRICLTFQPDIAVEQVLMATNTILLIHGLWMTPLSWEKWIARYEAQGHNVLAPAWPGIPDDIDEYRRDPSSTDGLGILDMADHYERIIKTLPEQPIIMGHSLGGLYTQILLDRGLGSAGVAIDSVPIRGVFLTPLTQLKSLLPFISNPANNHKSLPLTFDQFKYTFANTMEDGEAQAAFERYAVPGPDHTLFQTALANLNPHAASTVNVDNEHRAPLLLIAGGEDHIIPPSVTKANFDLYKHSSAVTEFKEFPGRGHFITGQQGWEEVADYALEWALRASATGVYTRA